MIFTILAMLILLGLITLAVSGALYVIGYVKQYK